MPTGPFGIEYSYTQGPPQQMAALGCTWILPAFVCAFFMASYGFNNPDVDETGLECYARHGDNIGYPFAPGKNVTSEFETWFKFGFIINMAYLVVGLLQIVHYITELAFIGAIWMCIGIPMGCGTVAWFITGMVFRWRHIG